MVKYENAVFQAMRIIFHSGEKSQKLMLLLFGCHPTARKLAGFKRKSTGYKETHREKPTANDEIERQNDRAAKKYVITQKSRRI